MASNSSIAGIEALFVGGMVALLAITIFICLVVGILKLIALYRLFEKAGEKGWKAIIPIYNSYVLTRLTWDTKYFWISLGVSLCSSLIIQTNTDISGNPNSLAAFIELSFWIFTIIMNIFYCIKIAKSYGKSEGFAIGLIFLNTIFICILAFGKAAYIGPEGVKPKSAKSTTKKTTTKSAKK